MSSRHCIAHNAKRYLAEFVRVLKVGAIGVFSLPTGIWGPAASAADAPPPPADPGARDHLTPSIDRPEAPIMEMYGIRADEVEAVLTAAGARVERRIPDARGGPGVEGYRYVIRRIAGQVPSLPRPSLAYLAEALAAVPDRADRFPPIITRRSGRTGRVELTVRRGLARALRPITWVQTEYDAEMLRALTEVHETLRKQDAELRRLEREVARMKAERGEGEDLGADG